MVVIASIC